MRDTDGAGREGKGVATYLPKEEAGLLFPPDRTALLVIDPVNDFLSEGGADWEMTKTTVEMNDVIGHLKVEVYLGIKDTREVEEGVINNEYDFGFVGGHLVGDEIDVLPWLTDEVVLVAPPGHPLARKRQVRLKDLAKERFIFREQGSATQAAVEGSLRGSGLQLEAVMEMSNPEAVKQAVQGGLGLAFLSRFAVGAELKAKTLVPVSVRDLDVRRELKIVHRRDKHLSRAARAFIETAK